MPELIVVKPSVTVNFHPLLALRMLLNPEITRKAMAEEINYTGNRALTQIRRKLADQTKIAYGQMMQAVTLRPASPRRLMANIKVKDKVPDLGKFMTSYTSRPKSWRAKGWRQTMRIRVWAGSQKFPVRAKNVFVADFGRGRMFIVARKGKGRLPLKVLSGPNLAGGKPNTGEVQRLQTGFYITTILPVDFANRVMARIDRITKGSP